MINSKEIAKIAGVSRSTVSRVINGYPNVPQKTKEKVLEVIKKYNYRPNYSARVLSGKKTNTLGIFVVSLNRETNGIFRFNLFQNNYFGPFVDALIDLSNSNGFHSLVQIIYKKEEFSKMVDTFAEMRIDGGIIIGLDRKERVILDISKTKIPFTVVHYDENFLFNNVEQDCSIGVVNTMDYEAGVEATEYLVSMGHKNIAFLSGRFTNYSGYERFRGFLTVMKRYNLPIRRESIIHGDFLLYKTEIEIKKLINSKNLPTAILCCNDDMALVTLKVFKENGIKVPEDISIMGFDNIPFAEYSNPPLTTMNLPIYEIADKSFFIFENLTRKKRPQNKNFVYKLPMNLVIRESVKKLG